MGRPLLFMIGGMFVVFSMIFNAINNRNLSIPQRSFDYYSELNLKNTLNSVMDYAMYSIINDENWKTGFASDDFNGVNVNVSVIDNTTPVNQRPNNLIFNENNWDDYSVVVHGTAIYDGYTATSEMLLSRNSYSKYSYLTEEETLPNGNNMWFIWTDVLFGPVHTNDTFHIAGAATFHGAVTSPNMWVNHASIAGDPNFFGGSNFSSGYVEFPTPEIIAPTRNAALSGGTTFDTVKYIEFLSDGNVMARTTPNSAGPENPGNTLINMSSTNGVISSTEDIHVKGYVKGGITVHSFKNIIIDGDVRYVADSEDPSVKLGLLGLVSEKDVIVSQNAHTANGSSNLTIHASIMAMDESFKVENFNQGSPRGELNLLGGIIQYRRGPVGTFSQGNISTGFAKNYIYDERLEFQHPPAFPRLQYFDIRYWLTRVEHN